MAYDPESFNPDIEVNMGEWKRVAGDQVIGTFGLGPCIGLAVYDPSEGVGFMAHTAAMELYTVRAMLDRVAKDGLQPDQLQAWLSGGDIIEFEGGSYYETIREDAHAILIARGLLEKNIAMSWVEDEGLADMTLDCGTGICTISHHDLSDDDPDADWDGHGH